MHEILYEGEDRIRALIVVGGNPMAAIGDPAVVRAALQRLELLVVIDPHMTDTARLAHYVVAPPLQFEVHDFNSFGDFICDDPFMQYSPPVIEPPAGTIEEWHFFNGIANRLGLKLSVKPFAFWSDAAAGPVGMSLSPDRPWTTEQVIDCMIGGSGFSCAQLARHPHGVRLDTATAPVAAPPSDDGSRLDVCPPDVFEETGRLLDTEPLEDGKYLLITRRLTDTMNTAYRQSPRVLRRNPNNSLFMNPQDMAVKGFAKDDVVKLRGRNGEIFARVKDDTTLRAGVVAMTHCWGSTDPSSPADGNVGRLVSIAIEDVANIDAMPQHSSIPVTLELHSAADRPVPTPETNKE